MLVPSAKEFLPSLLAGMGITLDLVPLVLKGMKCLTKMSAMIMIFERISPFKS